MKKFLSLVLALVMTMSLVTISAGAKDFTDDSKLNYKEAVDVISAVKVVDGYADGSFNPQATLTRGAAAKIICNLILGPTTASALSADAAPFSDVPANSTFAGYIAFCAKEGIIDGYADGTFKPGNSLTGYAFMKFLLGALGYDKDIEGYNGPNWSINVAKRALNIGLDDGLVDDFNGTKPVTREEACLYAFNTLTADMVEYGSKTTVTVGGAEVVVGAGEAKKIELPTTKDYRETDKDGYQQFCEAYFSNLKMKNATGITDEFGRPANTWYKKTTKIGTYTKAADATYTKKTESGDIYADLDLSNSYNYDYIVDGVPSGTKLIQKKNDTVKAGTGNGSLVEVFKDEQVISVINTYLLQVASDYDEKNEDLDLEEIQVGAIDIQAYPTWSVGALTLSSDDFADLDAYKEDDYVIVTVAHGDIQTIAPAEVVTGAITEYVHKESVTVGGSEYAYAGTVDTTISDSAWSLKDDYNVYLDPYGYALWVDGVSVDDEYMFIYEFSTHSNSSKASAEAYGYFTDGTEAEMTISKINGTKVYANDVNAAASPRLTSVDVGLATANTGWYTFVEKDGKYELTSIANQTGAKTVANATPATAVVDYSVTHTQINAGGTIKEGNTKTNFIVLESDGDVRVYTGIKNVPDVYGATAGTATVVDMSYSGSYAVNVFIDLNDGKTTGGSNSSDTIFFYSLKNAGNDTDDDNYYTWKAVINDKVTTTKVEQSTPNGSLMGIYTNIEYNTKGYVVGRDQVTRTYALTNREDFSYQGGTVLGDTALASATVELKNNTLRIDTVDYFLADDYVIYTWDGSDLETVTAKQLAKDDLPADYANYTVVGVLNGDAAYTALYIYK